MTLEVWEPPKQPNPFGPKEDPTGQSCPSCGGPVVRGMIPCPDGRPGCCVLHIGLKCSKCGALLREKP